MAGLQDPSPCQSCGACCSFSADWPRFTLEEDAAIARIPEAFVARSGMRCIGDRCSALQGKIGEATACSSAAEIAGISSGSPERSACATRPCSGENSLICATMD